MEIKSSVFKIGIKGDNAILEDGLPQVAFIGRSNAGKSTLLNSLSGQKNLAITSKTPGRTKEINVFLINDTHYFMDLPGYGFAKGSGETLEKLSKLIFWYLFDSKHNQKVVLLIDAEIGPTKDDLRVLRELEKTGKDLVIVLNKVDKIPKSKYLSQLKKLSEQLRGHKLFPCSSKTKVGMTDLIDELLQE